MAEKDDTGTFSKVPPDGSLPLNHYRQALQYLEARGIPQELCDPLGLEIMMAFQWYRSVYPNSVNHDQRLAIKFKHYNYKGEEIEWSSVKFVDQEIAGATFAKKSKASRASPKGELIHAYLCPMKNWRDLQKGQRIYICESVLKAANVAILGFHAIGLNGVAAFSSAKKNVALLKEIMDLPWERLKLQPIILFDSDYAKYDITRAYETLGNKLVNLCRSDPPVYLPLDPGPDGDWGFDDARHAYGDEWALEFLNGGGIDIALDPVKLALHDMNDKVIVVRDISSVIELKTANIMSESKFRNVNYANVSAWTNDDKPKKILIAKEWLGWPDRSEVEALEYMPGEEQIANDKFNLWKGMGTEPKEGDVHPWLDVIYNNIRDPAEQKHLIQWCAYPVQNLGAKLMSSAVLVGTQGTGKSLFGQTLGAVYGRNNYAEVSREDLASNFNSYWVKSQLVVIEEMRGERRTDKAFMSKLKQIITSDVYSVKQKHVQEYYITNHVNFLFTTNDADALALEPNDRRFFIAHFEPVVDRYRDVAYWNRYLDWLRGPGPAALHHYLLNVDLEGFDPGEPALQTEYKQVMEEAAYSGPEAWIKALWETPNDILPSDRSIWSSLELVEIYYEGDVRDARAQAVSLSRQMLTRGFSMANKNSNIGDKKLGRRKYWIIRDRDNPKWHDHAECLAHLRKFTSEFAQGEKY